MARDRRPTRTPPATPRRTPRRPRATVSSVTTGGAKSAVGRAAASKAAQRAGATLRKLPALPSRLGLTRRALIVIAVVVLLGLSYANSLRIYVGQANDLATAEAQIKERSDRIAELEDELRRWDDPAFVRAQARERLGWVVPGETGFRVLGPDGKPLGSGVVITSQTKLPAGEHAEMWFDRVWASMQAADSPVRKVG